MNKFLLSFDLKYNFSIVGSKNDITSKGIFSVIGKMFKLVCEIKLYTSAFSLLHLFSSITKITSFERYSSFSLRYLIG